MDWASQLLLFAISLVANIFSAFAGGGAGLVQFPALIFLGLSFAVALATHKIASVALGVGATLRHMREGSMERNLSLWILATGLPGVLIGAASILQVPERWARLALGLLTIGLGLYSIANKKLGLEYRRSHRGTWGHAIGGTGLFVIGVLNGSLSSGTGLFCTMWLVRWYGMDYRRAVAHTLILVGMFWNGAVPNDCLLLRVLLERRRRDHAGYTGQGSVVVVAGVVAWFLVGRLYWRALVDTERQSLDQARLRSRYHHHRPQVDK